MATYLFATWDGAGNLLPTLGIAERLAHAGHSVHLLGHTSIAQRCAPGRFEFLPFPTATAFDSCRPPADVDEFDFLARHVYFGGNVAADTLSAIDRVKPDVLVGDCVLTGALSAGEAAGVPTAALFHMAYGLFRGGPLLDLAGPYLQLMHAMRAELRLQPVSGIPDLHDRCDLALVAVPREFEPPAPHGRNARFIGPVLGGPGLAMTDPPPVLGDVQEPLIVVSFSTSQMGQATVLQLLVRALANLRVRVLVTTGPAVDPTTIETPPNAIIAGYVDHDEVLPRASLVVTHAGLGTVMTALSHGVPMLCLPMGRDQFFNAARVQELGAGRVLPLDANPEVLAATAQGLIEDAEARAAAKRLAKVIAGYGGARDAVHKLERLASGKSRTHEPEQIEGGKPS